MKRKIAPFDRKAFLNHFQGMPDIALHAVEIFLKNLPNMIADIDDAIKMKNSSKLKFSARALKDALAVFYAEPSMLFAWQLEQFGHGNIPTQASAIFSKLKSELKLLEKSFNDIKNKRSVA